jgi:hypothetical protein
MHLHYAAIELFGVFKDFREDVGYRIAQRSEGARDDSRMLRGKSTVRALWRPGGFTEGGQTDASRTAPVIILLAVLAETHFLLHGRQRSRNSCTSRQMVEFLKQTLALR